MPVGRVQSKSGFVIGGSSVTVVLDNPTHDGNALLVVFSCFYGSAPYTSISDNASPASSFTASPGDVNLSYQGTLCIASAFGIKGRAGHAVTVSLASQYYNVTVIEVEGITALDQTHTRADPSPLSTYTSGLTSTTNYADEYLLGAHSFDGSTNTSAAVPDAASGWSKVEHVSDGSFHKLLTQDRIVIATGNYESNGAGDHFDQSVIATYRIVSGAGPISGSLSGALANVTAVTEGFVGSTPIVGITAASLGPLTTAPAAGTVEVRGALEANHATLNLAYSLQAKVDVAAALSRQLDALTNAPAQGTVDVRGALVPPLGVLTVLATGTVGALSPINASLSQQLGPLTTVAPAAVAVGASLSLTLDPLAPTTAVTAAIAAALASQPLGPLGFSAQGTAAIAAALAAQQLAALVLGGSGVVGGFIPAVAVLVQPLGPLTIFATGTVEDALGTIHGVLSGGLLPLVSSSAGMVFPIPANCAVTTLGDLQALMQQRWDGVVFWTPEEARLAINEALREWNLLTGTWRAGVTLSVAAGNPEVALPRTMTYNMRITTIGYGAQPLTPSSLAEFDLGRPSWRGETTASGGNVPTRPTLWAPVSLTRIAIWPTLPVNAFALACDGVMATPVLFGHPLQPIDLNEEIIDYIVDMALHIVAFKEGGARWRATRPYFEAFLQAAAEENAILKTNQRYRRWAGLDRRRDIQPSTGAKNQIEGVAREFSRHDRSETGQ